MKQNVGCGQENGSGYRLCWGEGPFVLKKKLAVGERTVVVTACTGEKIGSY